MIEEVLGQQDFMIAGPHDIRPLDQTTKRRSQVYLY
jgi:hypothetical protein